MIHRTRNVDVLLVDDSEADVLLTRRMLRMSECPLTLRVARDGEEALTLVAGKTPDLILLDLNMPRLGGLGVLEALRSGEGPSSRVPVLMLSSSTSEQDIQQSYRLGANAYVNKPQTLEQSKETALAIAEFWFGVARLPA